MYCEYEAKDLPDSEFKVDPIYGWVHNVLPLHTIAGDLIDGGGPNIPLPKPLPVRERPLPGEPPGE